MAVNEGGGKGAHEVILHGLRKMLLGWAAFLFCILPCAAQLEEEVGYATVDGRVAGHRVYMEGKVTVDIDMKVPDDFPSLAYTYQLEDVSISQKDFDEALKGNTYQNTDDFYWGVSVETKNFEESYRFLEVYGKSNVEGFIPYDGIPFHYQDTQKIVEVNQAERVVKEVLTKLGIPYVYPFYSSGRIQDLYEGMFQNESTNAKRALSAEIMGVPILDDSLTFIVARYPVGELTMAPATRVRTQSAAAKNKEWDAGGYAVFIVDDLGKIINTSIDLPMYVKSEIASNEAVIPWQQALDLYLTSNEKRVLNNYTQLGYTVRYMEPCYLVTKQGVSYPAWRIVILVAEEYMNTSISKLMKTEYYQHCFIHAVTGEIRYY